MNRTPKVLMLFPEDKLDGEVARCEWCQHYTPMYFGQEDPQLRKCSSDDVKRFILATHGDMSAMHREFRPPPDWGCAMFEVRS